MSAHRDTTAGARSSRLRALALGLGGVLVALLLIAGSVAGLDRQLLGDPGWHRFEREGGEQAVVLPSAPAPLGDLGGDDGEVLGATATEPPSRRPARRAGADREDAPAGGRDPEAPRAELGSAEAPAGTSDPAADGLDDSVEYDLRTDAFAPEPPPAAEHAPEASTTPDEPTPTP